MRLLYCSDIHLGRQPFQLEARFRDFARIFDHLIGRAIEERVGAFLIGGDLFDKRNINAATLAQATDALSALRSAGIPVVAIEGNHDRAFRHDRSSWLEYLSRQGYVRLLKPTFTEGEITLPGWDASARSGAWIALDGVRIVGLGWQGASIGHVLSDALPHLPEPPEAFTILMLHSGIGDPDRVGLGEASLESLAALQGRVHLILLGHWHRHMEWALAEDSSIPALMPGSPEICDIQEAEREHGFFLIDTPAEPGEAPTISFERTPHRPHRRVSVSVDGCATGEDVARRVLETLDASDLRALAEPVVEVTIEGRLPFDPLDVPIEAIRTSIGDAYRCLHVEVVNNANLPVAIRSQTLALGGREAVERETLRSLIEESDTYAAHADLLTDLVTQWRTRAGEEDTDEGLHDDLLTLLFQAVEEIERAEARVAEESPPSSEGLAAEDRASENRTLTLPGFD